MVTAVISNREYIDGLDVVVQIPNWQEAEIESSRHILWDNQWQRVAAVAAHLKSQHPPSFRAVTIACRNGQSKTMWAPKAFRVLMKRKRSGRSSIPSRVKRLRNCWTWLMGCFAMDAHPHKYWRCFCLLKFILQTDLVFNNLPRTYPTNMILRCFTSFLVRQFKSCSFSGIGSSRDRFN